MIIGTGFSDDRDSASAADACAGSARNGLDGRPALAIAFCGGRHDPRTFLRALRKRLGNIPIVGGAAAGGMGAGVSGNEGFECVLLLFSSLLSPAAVIRSPDLRLGARAAGNQLAADLMPHLAADSRLLLLFDSVAATQPQPSLHAGSSLLAGLYDVLEPAFGEAGPEILGAGTIADVDFASCSYIFDGEGVAHHHAVVLVLPGELDICSAVTHGCVPASDFLVITRSEGGTVHELDGKPAMQRLAELLEVDASIILRQALSLGLTLGQKLGDPFAPFDENSYVNRLVIGADAATGSLNLLDTDLPSGLRVQLMLTDADEMYASADACACALMCSAEDGEQSLLAFYIDCAGRSSRAFGGEVEESELVGRHIPEGIPFLGVYAGVEIAPMRGRSRPLDWSGVLTLWRLRERRAPDSGRIGVT